MSGGESFERGLKKGPWTAAEDAVLTEYVNKHGEGNWNAVMKNSGLMRCGKSCRLRWANHLRPNLKKGCFTAEEEEIIIDLHAKLGNKWARMASQLPGRTDNEIKNYWNTRMKRRQRSGLPVDTQDNQEELSPFQFQNQKDKQNMIMHTSSISPSSSSSLSSISSYQPRKRLCLNPLTNSSMCYQMFGPFPSHQKDHYNTRLGFSQPFSTASSSSDLRNLNHFLEFTSDNANANKNKINSYNFDVMSYGSLLMGEETRHSSFPLSLDIELPSNQTPAHSFTRNTLDDVDNDLAPRGNSGLLDALLEESRNLGRRGMSKETTLSSTLYDKEKKAGHGEEAKNRSVHISSSDQSSTGTNPNNNKDEEPTSENIIVIEDDNEDLLASLLNNFPSSAPLPDLYRSTGNQTDGSDFISAAGTIVGNH